jgi:oligopeptide/dipeptide ABC transporter ATP-binding protein
MLLKIDGLKTYFKTAYGLLKAVDNVNLSIPNGSVVSLLGESGCGKTITAFSILRLIKKPGKIIEGSINFNGTDILKIPEKKMQSIRGREISMIFQEPMTALNPSFTVEYQIKESLKIHKIIDKSGMDDYIFKLFRSVNIPNPKIILKSYPFSLSGGLRQRVTIAIALSCSPQLLIADEPTTALDVTIQFQILKLLKKIKEERNISILFITHDLGIVADIANYIYVMYTGKVVEKGYMESVFKNPGHPYTEGLLRSYPAKINKNQVKELYSIRGVVPSLYNLPEGCTFYPRCDYAKKLCKENVPELLEIEDNHYAACFKAQGLI